jgi:hypothetical protein
MVGTLCIRYSAQYACTFGDYVAWKLTRAMGPLIEGIVLEFKSIAFSQQVAAFYSLISRNFGS